MWEIVPSLGTRHKLVDRLQPALSLLQPALQQALLAHGGKSHERVWVADFGGEGYRGEVLEGGGSRQPRQLRASTGRANPHQVVSACRYSTP